MISTSIRAQVTTSDHFSGEFLVILEKSVDVKDVCEDFRFFNGKEVDLKAGRRLARSMNIWQLYFRAESADERALLEALRLHPAVHIAQFNHHNLTSRVTPNDPQFSSQWDMNSAGDIDIDAPEAWNITTGGTTTDGDEIVVAVVDGGFDLTHPDLTANYWKNTDEIAGNGIDDDGNGYIDDRDGWNAYNNNGTISSDSHGTHVAGTVGARGNNSIGVTGVNWNVKIMPVMGSTSSEATAVAAYGYILDERKLYNQTNGAQGSFVVSTNASFGVDYGQPSNYPLWCAMYDSLGVAGIVSCGATANLNIDIDAQGDIPTACASDYLISVTNTTSTDAKNGGAAYGLTTIDLGAPGTSILSTLPSSSYGNLTGTSMATPHVAGAVGLIVAAACNDFIVSYKTNPGNGALALKAAILNGTDPISALNGITVTGGRLNLYGAIMELVPGGVCNSSFTLTPTASSSSVCKGSTGNVSVNVGAVAGFSNPVTLSVSGLPSGVTASFNANPVTPVGASTLTFNVTNAAAVGTYTLTISGVSGSITQTASYQLVVVNGAPTAATLSSPANGASNQSTSPVLTWSAVSGATSYTIQIATDATFSNMIVNQSGIVATSYTASGLLPSSTYYWQVITYNGCGNSTSAAYNFITQSVSYCASAGTTFNEEWIASVTVNGTTYTSSNPAGYEDFTSNTFTVWQNTSPTISLVPAFSGTSYGEYWRIWVDWNNDGDFDDTGELAFDAGATSTTTVTGSLSVPQAASNGTHRMRVAMKWNAASTACETFQYGQVEDYSIDVQSTCQETIILTEPNYTYLDEPTWIQSFLYIQASNTISSGAEVIYTAGEAVYLVPPFHAQAGVDFQASIYYCGGITKGGNEQQEEKNISIAENINSTQPLQVVCAPNPFNWQTIFTYRLPQDGIVSLQVYDTMGRLVAKSGVLPQMNGLQQLAFERKDLSAGMYVYTLQYNDTLVSGKMIIE
ncbi:MAG: S8 family serine peptidase [Sphingobacteriales bacterium]|nr:S8 family serine peptidase [Sphingobacteriales bacterium]